jgi:hypothetical protein
VSESIAPMALAIDRPARRAAFDLYATDLRREILSDERPISDRNALLMRLARLIEAHADEIRALELHHVIQK